MNHSTYTAEWAGSTDPDDLSGVATFRVNGFGIVCTVPLASFSDFQMVEGVIGVVAYESERVATQNLRDKIMQALSVDLYV